MTKGSITVVRIKAAAEIEKLEGVMSREKKREYQLQEFTLSELVSDLWWTNRETALRKVSKAGKIKKVGRQSKQAGKIKKVGRQSGRPNKKVGKTS